jgi:Flp pilus assembly pilin Flp
MDTLVSTVISTGTTRQYAQGMAEYGLVLALVAVVSIVGLLVFGSTVSVMISNLSSSVSVSV